MFSNVGHAGIYRAGGGAGNHQWRAGAVLLAGTFLLATGCARPRGAGASASAGAMAVTHAVAWGAADLKAVTVGMEINNQGDVDDTLVAVTSPSGAAMLHTEVPGQGMRPIPTLPLPRRSAIRIGRGLHLMVEALQAAPATGATIPVTLRFARAGPMELSIPVLRYSEALTALGE
jgi:periplasmic copper chaperone A